MSETFDTSWFDRVKRESRGDSCVSQTAYSGLYPQHEVKPELVLGPELLQPQDVTYTILRQFGTPIKVEKDAVNKRRVSETQLYDEQLPEPCDDLFLQQVEQNSVKQEQELNIRSGDEQLFDVNYLELVEKNAVNHKQDFEDESSDRKPLDACSLGQVEKDAVKQETYQAKSNLERSIDIEEDSDKLEQYSLAENCDQLPVDTRNLQGKNAVKVEQGYQAQTSDEQSIVCLHRVEQDSVHQEQDICAVVDAGFISPVQKDDVKQEIGRSFNDRVIKQLLTPCLVHVDRLPDMKFFMSQKALPQKSTLIAHTQVHVEENMSSEIKDVQNDIKEYSLEISWDPIETEINFTNLIMSNEKRTNDAVRVNRKANIIRKKKYHCETCGEKFTAKSKLKTHSRRHREKKPKIERRKRVIIKNYKCHYCGRWFDVKIKIIAHIQIHMGLKPYVCGTCGSQYTSLPRLERHERTHTGVKPFVCDICDKRYPCKYSISRHIMKHMGVTLYNCKICNKGFILRSTMVVHELVHAGIKSHTCEICEKQFLRRGALNAHILTHTNVRKIICEVCGKTMSSLKSLKKHKLIHAGVKPYPCEFCKKKYRTLWAMRLHSMRIHSKGNARGSVGSIDLLGNPNLSGDKQMDPEDISDIQRNASQIENSSEVEIPPRMPHIENLASNKEEQETPQSFLKTIESQEMREIVDLLPCFSDSSETQIPLETSSVRIEEASRQVQFETDTLQSEDNAFDVPEVTTISQEPIEVSRDETDNYDAMRDTVKMEVTIEMSEKEAKKKLYFCDICGKGYTEKNQLMPHFRVHTGEFRCEFCDKTFAYPCHLTKHKQKHTEKPMRYSCDVCKMKFRGKRSLEAHSRVHTGKKLHPCKLCSKQFNAGHKLKTHMRTHTGEKPYFCDICDKRFGQHGNLARHKRIHAAENKPYSCDICQKRFVTRAYATIHKKIHTGEKPYTCEICSRQFLHRASYYSHKRFHEGPKEKRHTCKICNAKFTTSGHLTRHHQIHTGVKPFSCDLCGKRFYCRASLGRHTQNQKRPCVD